jgi:hypothetical protein
MPHVGDAVSWSRRVNHNDQRPMTRSEAAGRPVSVIVQSVRRGGDGGAEGDLGVPVYDKRLLAVLRSFAMQSPNRMRTRPIFALCALAAILGLCFGGVTSANGASAERKCSSFASQKAAQKFFIRQGGSESNDAGGLDPDGDGLVCPDNFGPFAAYVEIGFAKGFFYGKVVCVNYPAHKTKNELKEAEKAEKEGEAPQCYPGFIEVDLKKVAPGADPVVASHKAAVGEEPTRLPIGASEKNAKGTILSFEWKITPKATSGTFYALSEEAFGTPSRHIRGAPR